MKNSISIMKYVFCIIGLAILIQTFFIYQEKRTLIEKADVVEGTVVDNSTNDSPVVCFSTKDGRRIKFTSYINNNLLSYKEGEAVEVLYDPENPNKAKINNFSTLYMGVSILGFLGTVFFLTGLSFFIVGYSQQKKIYFLQQNGKTITTKFIDVQLNLNMTVNGSHPYFICSEWLDSKTNEIYSFESEDIWFDPTDFIKTKEIKVIIDTEDPSRYLMDISFLPENKN